MSLEEMLEQVATLMHSKHPASGQVLWQCRLQGSERFYTGCSATEAIEAAIQAKQAPKRRRACFD